MGFSLKQLTSFTIMGVAAVIAGVILRSGSTSQPVPETAVLPPPAGPRVEKVTEHPEAAATAAAPGQKNFTERFALDVGKDVIARNQDGPISLDGKEWLAVSRPEEITEEAVRKALDSFDPNEFRVPADASRIVRSKKNDLAAITLYLRELQNTLAKRFGTLDVRASEIQRTETLERLIAAYDGALLDFYALAVPEELVAEHLDEITLVGTQREIFARMKDYERDPLGAILAMSIREKIDEEFASLSARIVRFMTEKSIVL